MCRDCYSNIIDRNIIKGKKSRTYLEVLHNKVSDMFFLLVFVLLCIFHVNIISCHTNLTNVAYSKPITMSSHYDYTSYHTVSNAVNGLLTDLTAIAEGTFPWLRIDLSARFKIMK